jgi:O-antigen ligase
MPRDLLVPAPVPEPGEPTPSQRPDLIGSTGDRFGAIGEGRDLRTLFVLNALPIIRDHPILGVGPGRYGGTIANSIPTPIYEEYDTDVLFKDPTQRTVDNFWLHILVETGVLGLAAFLVAAILPGLGILRRVRRTVGWRRVLLTGIAAGTAGIAVNSVTTMLLEANSVAFVFWFFLGVGTLLIRGAPAPEHPTAVGPQAPTAAPSPTGG